MVSEALPWAPGLLDPPQWPNLMWPTRMESFVRKSAAVLVLASLVLVATPIGAASTADPGDGVTVAVLDTGVDSAHSELVNRVDRVSFYKPQTPPVPPLPGIDPFDQAKDPDGSGTAVASVVAGTTVGVAKGARILDLQVSAKYTGTALDSDTESAATEAMQYLLDHHGAAGGAGARIAVLSFASNMSAEAGATLAAQAHGLWADGVLVVVPAATGAQSALHSSPYVLTVGDKDAGCGPGVPPASVLKPDLSAQARGVRVATPGNAVAPRGMTTAPDTTRVAAAAVAGAAARMWQARPDLPVDAMQAILRDTAQPAGAAGPDVCTGFGALDVEAAVAAAEAWSSPVPPGTGGAVDTPAPVAPAGAVLLLLLALAVRRRVA